MIQKRLSELREQMKKGGIDAYLILTEDFHGSEYVGDYFKCRKYMSGFTGSAGNLLVMQDSAGLWTDGRYFLQAENQLKDSTITLFKSGEEGVPTLSAFLKENMPENGVLGFDGRAVNYKTADALANELKDKKVTICYQEDLVDRIWKDRPELSKEPVMLLEECYTGKSRADKLKDLLEEMKKEKADVFFLASLDDIAWLLNIRGNDVKCNPVVLSYFLMDEDKKTLYINEETLSEKVKNALAADGIGFKPYNDIYDDLSKLDENKTLLLDFGKANYAAVMNCPADMKKLNKPNPTAIAKCIKNSVEVENEKLAHIKDGVVLTKLIYWLKKNVGKIEITELSVEEKLEELHREQENYMGPSFEPIIGFAEHGAIIHYSATEESNVALEPRNMVLMDTGGQYLEGTTDITRTVVLGEVSQEEKEAFTMVLRGHLNLAAAKFKEGCCGMNLDYLARSPLWEKGMDYNHGTGHGVGYFLNVHEGPVSFHWRMGDPGRIVSTVLKEGMIISDEPGYYENGKFGIRTENLIVCKKAEKTQYGQFMEFEPLTMVPIDLEAVLPEQMSERERALLNAYHKKVYETIAPLLEQDEAEWLKNVTRAI